MQDSNNENTLPTPTHANDANQNRDTGDTRPTRTNPPAPIPSGTMVSASPEVVQPAPPPLAPPPPGGVTKPAKAKRWPWFVLGIVIVIIFGTVGGFFGYRSAVELRKSAYAEQVVNVATRHFMLGLEAQEKGQYSIARQQFEHVISLDPNFPGVEEKLAQVMIAMAATETPTTAPTPTEIPMTPTPDTRSQEEIFNTARQQFVGQDWDGVLASIDSLRAIDPTYNSIACDGMLYVTYRFIGIRKIYQEANLEGGIYDLALAERYAPLDSDAAGARNWARLYLNGVSFWGADWARVVAAFEQIYPAFPNLRDSTGLTAQERFRQAAIEQGKALDTSGDRCGAVDYYEKALSIAANEAVEQLKAAAYNACHPATDTPPPSGTPTVTVPVVETTPVPVETTPAPVETTPVPTETTAPLPTETTEPPPPTETTAPAP